MQPKKSSKRRNSGLPLVILPIMAALSTSLACSVISHVANGQYSPTTGGPQITQAIYTDITPSVYPSSTPGFIPSETYIPSPTSREPTATELCTAHALKIVLFGDSITYHQNVTGIPLQTDLQKALPNRAIDFSAKGYPCQRIDSPFAPACGSITNILAPMDVFYNTILPAHPDYVMLWFGMNADSAEHASAQAADYAKISRDMVSSGITPIILTTIPNCGNPIHDSYLTTLAEQESEFAEKNGYLLIDVRQLLEDTANSCSTYYQDDGIHLSQAGQEFVSEYVASRFAETYGCR